MIIAARNLYMNGICHFLLDISSLYVEADVVGGPMTKEGWISIG